MGARNADVSKLPTPKKGDKVSLRMFAAYIGVDYASARAALENGRIQYAPGSKLIDWATQKEAFQETRQHRLEIGDNGAKKISGMTPLGQAKLRKENAAASLKEIELSAERGQILEKEQVKQAMFKWSRAVRDAVLTMPDRIASEVASQINATLKKEKRAKATDAEVERIVREAWIKESVAVLEAVDKAPEVKGPKAKLKNEAESDDEET